MKRFCSSGLCHPYLHAVCARLAVGLCRMRQPSELGCGGTMSGQFADRDCGLRCPRLALLAQGGPSSMLTPRCCCLSASCRLCCLPSSSQAFAARIIHVPCAWSQAFSFGSPKALLRALLPQSSPVDRAGDAAQHSERVVAFKRYLAEVEAKGGGEAVPDFPAGAAWFNAPPLKLSRCARTATLSPCPCM